MLKSFSSTRGAVTISLTVVIALIVIKAVIAWLGGSVSILAQLLDSGLDLLAISIAIVAVKQAGKSEDERHPFGHGKFEPLAAGLQSGLILFAGGVIIYTSVSRIVDSSVVELTEAGMAVMLVSSVSSFFLARYLSRVANRTGSNVLDALAKNVSADVYSTAGVFAGLLVVRLTGIQLFDPIIALLVAGLIIRSAYLVVKRSFGELTDASLSQEEISVIDEVLGSKKNIITGVHKLRSRRAGAQRFVDFHLVIPRDSTLEAAHKLTDYLEDEIRTRLSNTSIVIHVEPCDPESDCVECRVEKCDIRKESGKTTRR